MVLSLLGAVLAYCLYVSVHYGRPSQDEEYAEQGREALEARVRLDERDAYADDMDLAELRFYAHTPTQPATQPWWVPFSES